MPLGPGCLAVLIADVIQIDERANNKSELYRKQYGTQRFECLYAVCAYMERAYKASLLHPSLA